MRPRARLPLALLAAASFSCRQVLDIEALRLARDASAPDAGTPAPDGAALMPPEPEGPASCRDLRERCGATGADSCCAVERVPGGRFLRSNDPAHPAVVSAFELDKYEVTVERLRRFVDAGRGTRAQPPAKDAGAHPRLGDSGWQESWNAYLPVDRAELLEALSCSDKTQTWTDVPAGNELRPANCVNWFVAFAFCAFDGGRLPTEAEWNAAATGGALQRPFPWGSAAPDRTRASFACLADGSDDCSIADLTPVGSHPAGDSAFGHADLAGNVFEWVRDAYAGQGIYPEDCEDCADLRPSVATDRIMRGGDFATQAADLATSVRGHGGPSVETRQIGVRCAHDVE